MHIPDGFLDGRTALVAGLISTGSVGIAFRRARTLLEPRRIPLIGLTAAFIFVAQLVNFPVTGGTSGHLIGATLAVILAGPSVAILMMTNVLLIQAFLFADGGVVALGANVLNMAVVAPLVGAAVYRSLRLLLPKAREQLVAASIAAWASTVAASVACSLELVASGVAPWTTIIPAMTAVHSLIGIGEGLITMLVLAAVAAARPELLRPERAPLSGSRRAAVAGVLALAVCAGLLLLAPHASALPDGLEYVASALRFEGHSGPTTLLHAPMEGYHLPGAGDAAILMSLSGIIGAVVVALLSFLVARLLVRRRPAPASSPAGNETGT